MSRSLYCATVQHSPEHGHVIDQGSCCQLAGKAVGTMGSTLDWDSGHLGLAPARPLTGCVMPVGHFSVELALKTFLPHPDLWEDSVQKWIWPEFWFVSIGFWSGWLNSAGLCLPTLSEAPPKCHQWELKVALVSAVSATWGHCPFGHVY